MANTVLIVSPQPDDARILSSTLVKARDGPFEIQTVTSLAQARERLSKGEIDIVLADLFLPDSQGIGSFDALFGASGLVPIMVLSNQEDEDLAVEAVQRGAQGFLSRGHFENTLVPQALRNVIQRKNVEDALFVEKERARVTLDSIGDGVLSTDVGGRITYLNKEAERLTGWSNQHACGRPFAHVFNLIDSATRKPALNPLGLVINQGKPMALYAASVLVQRDGGEVPIEDSIAPIFDRQGKVTGAVVTFRDVSETQRMAQRMTHMAQHDFLTGLPNRMLLSDRLLKAIAHARRHHTQLAILYLDLDKFKHINDSLGHSVGDQLLQLVAQRLSAQVRDSDTVSRQGGDEFVLLLLEDARAENAIITAEKILSALAQPFFIDTQELHITTSIGISVYPADGGDAETLIKHADTAMYHAKKKGRATYRFFKEEMNLRAVERQSIEAELRRAIDRNEFVLHYQPKVELLSGRITGAEALIRWHHPSRGIVLPAHFIAIAEDCGLIVPIGYFVMRQACWQAAQWLAKGMAPIPVAINVSALEFRHKDFIECLSRILFETGLNPALLELELTESVLIQDVQKSVAILNELKAIGVRLAVDDFGTGYSSLSYLKQFPIDVLKIDQSFIHDICAGADNGIIVSAVVGMGIKLKHTVIAEGVETREELEFLRKHDCDEGQGYYFSCAVPADQFAAMRGSILPQAETFPH